MKVARCILKLTAVCLALAAITCCVVAYWDKIWAFFTRAGETLRKKKADCPICSSEYEDYADWE